MPDVSPSFSSAKTRTIYTQIPNTAQYDLADWSHLHEHTHAGAVDSLESAKSKAADDRNISFFCHLRDGMYLSRNGYFGPGDNVFFSGVPWLGSAPMADTYFVAEAYDLDDDATRAAIQKKIESIELGTRSAPTLRSAKEPVVGGFVFVNFSDTPGAQVIQDTFDALTSYTDTDKTTKTTAQWLQTESNGRFHITFEVHSENAAGRWVTMKEKSSAYQNDPDKIKKELQADKVTALPSTWDIVYVVVAQDAGQRLFGSKETDCNWSGRDLEIVYLDNTTLAEQNDRDWAVVAHETLHALGLPDLYLPGRRSFGWSMMADVRTAWHLLGWEKMLLGWLDPQDYVWIKSGLVSTQIYGALAAAGKTKGVVMFDGEATCAYVIEPAQATGRTAQQRDTSKEPALLFYRVELRTGNAQIVPLVNRWASDAAAGGASKAPYPVPAVPTSNPDIHDSVFLQLMAKGGEKADSWIQAYVARTADWKPSESAMMLREGEFLQSESGRYRLVLTVEGQLEFQMKGLQPTNKNTYLPMKRFVPSAKTGREYGFYCLVNGTDGTVAVFSGTGPDNKGDTLWSAGQAQAQGHFFLWLVDTPTGCHVSVYSGRDHTDPDHRKKYDLLDWTDGGITGEVRSLAVGDLVYSAGTEYQLTLNSDHNLVLYDVSSGTPTWSWSAFTDENKLPTAEVSAGFDDGGHFQLTTTSDPATQAWTSTGTVALDPEPAKRQFFLRVGTDGKVRAYQGAGPADSGKKELYVLNT